MTFHLTDILKVLLFSTHEPLNAEGVQKTFQTLQSQKQEPGTHKEANREDWPDQLTQTAIETAFQAIETEWNKHEDSLLKLSMGPLGYQVATTALYKEWVLALRGQAPPRPLSKAAFETLAIIAYRQPVIRAEIETIKGSSCDTLLQGLIQRDLIEVSGKLKTIGQAYQYSTTPTFLQFCDLKSLKELPACDELPEADLAKWLKQEETKTKNLNQAMGLSKAEEPQKQSSAPEKNSQ